MRRLLQLGLGLLVAAALSWHLLGQGNSSIRVYVEPTYEQDRLQRLLALQPDLVVVSQAGSEDVALLVEGVPAEEGERLPRAAIRARSSETGYEVYALAQFLPVRNTRGGRARWMSSFAEGVHEDNIAEILYSVVVEAALQEHRDVWRSPREIERAMTGVLPSS